VREKQHYLGEGIRYVVMSCGSALLTLGVPFMLHEGLSIPPDIAVAVGLSAAFVVNFTTARGYVFKKNGPVGTQFSRFALVSVLFRLSEYLGFLLLYGLIGIQYMIANTSVLLTSFCIKFFVYKIFVFVHSKPQLQTAAEM
jgi:putative flippase GtrA